MASILSNIKEMFQSEDDPEQFRDDFIYWWDDISQENLEIYERKSIFEKVSENKVFVTHLAILLSVLPLLVYVGLSEPYFALIFGLVILALIIVSYIQIGNNYVLPYRVFVSNTNMLAENDLTGNDELLYSKEEYENLDTYDKARKSFVSLLKEFKDSSNSLFQEIELTKTQSTGVYRAIDQINLSIDNTIASTANYQETKGYLNQVSRGIDNFIENFDQTLDSISEVTNVLKSIGKQTTMLALNAGIEAAKAGEQGKGFQVVSSNLRRLADHAIESSNRIGNLTDEVNEKARIAIENITFGMASLSDISDNNHDTIVGLNNELFTSLKDLDHMGRQLAQLTSIVDKQIEQVKQFKY